MGGERRLRTVMSEFERRVRGREIARVAFIDEDDALAERLEKYGFEGDYLFVEANQRMLAEDTPERQERDRETVEAWYRAQGVDRMSEAEGAKEKLLAMLEARSGR